MDIKLQFCDNGVIARIHTPASEGTLESDQTMLFTSQATFMEWMTIQWAKEDQVDPGVTSL